MDFLYKKIDLIFLYQEIHNKINSKTAPQCESNFLYQKLLFIGLS